VTVELYFHSYLGADREGEKLRALKEDHGKQMAELEKRQAREEAQKQKRKARAMKAREKSAGDTGESSTIPEAGENGPPFICSQGACNGRTFAAKSSLSEHTRKNHKKRVECLIQGCGRVFRDNTDMQRHCKACSFGLTSAPSKDAARCGRELAMPGHGFKGAEAEASNDAASDDATIAEGVSIVKTGRD
jgi:hypothetical protein